MLSLHISYCNSNHFTQFMIVSVPSTVPRAAMCLVRVMAGTPRHWPKQFRFTMTLWGPCILPELHLVGTFLTYTDPIVHTLLSKESLAPPYIYWIRTWHCAEGSREERGNPHWTENANAALKTNETETQHYYAIRNQPINLFLPYHTPVPLPGRSSLFSPFLPVWYLFNFFFTFFCPLICCHLQYLKSVQAAALLHSVYLTDSSVSDVQELEGGRVRLGCCFACSGHIIGPKVLLATT